MEFYCGTGLRRPVRLCEATRQFAMESLRGAYGDEAMKTPYVTVDDLYDFDQMEEYEQYSCCIDAIVRHCPLRILPGESIIGSATLGAAIRHVVPAFRNGNAVFSSVSHVTLGFDRVLTLGINGLERELSQYGDRPYNRWLRRTISHMRLWHSRYLAEAAVKNPKCRDLLLRVPFQPARTFHEAVQSLWFTFAFTRLCGNWSGIGRIDEMLGPYLKADLANGVLTLDEAREILAHFFIKGCEWIQKDTPVGSGDAQHYQNIVLGGVSADGREVVNEVTYLVLDIVEELGISDFPITVRLSKNTDDALLRRVAEVMRYGGGILAVYNEDLILSSLADLGYDPIEARRFANDGCWEVQIPGHTYFMY
ncbi:MAG: pyruvate formate lyase family protein, partial [Eubacteriales bacterium]